MCCEQVKCYVAVFDHTEAVCYLKGAGAMHTYDFKELEGYTAHEMLFREGAAPCSLFGVSVLSCSDRSALRNASYSNVRCALPIRTLFITL